MTQRRLVLDPSLAFPELDGVLSGLGWVGGPTIVYPPLVPGEPELARWARGAATFDYSCNPAVWFRVGDVAGVTAAEGDVLADALPHLEDTDALDLLTDERDDRVVLGIYAARALTVHAAAARLRQLRASDRQIVRELAAATLAELGET